MGAHLESRESKGERGTALADCDVEILAEDGELVISRAKTGHGVPSVLFAAPGRDTRQVAGAGRLRHTHDLREQLTFPGAVRPLEFTEYRGRPALLMEDAGGILLSQIVSEVLSVPEFLRLAIGIATALGDFHAHGLVHRDVKPMHIVVERESGRVRLTGLGAASRATVGRPSSEITGSLAYLAPERSGRMGRSIDSRSDLYSLGVTFYETLVGILPFTANDPMEWVHCHIARQPVPPRAVRGDVPEIVSDIVMKLLAKTPDDRFQTTAGLVADLRRCLEDWEATGRIEPFSLGSSDWPDQLRIPEKLYGREKEIHELFAIFDRVVRQDTPGFVLVSGYSGAGKSSMVREFQKFVVPSRGLFACGKFDQYRRDVPYATLAQAFQELVRKVLAGAESEMGRGRAALAEALGSNGALVANLIPEIELIVGRQPPVTELPPQEARHRFHQVLRRFLGVFAQPGHPLVLFLDDLQWLDAGTLEFLEDLMTGPKMEHLLVIGACRANEIDDAHPLARCLEKIRGTPRLHEIEIAPLRLDDVASLIVDTLRCAEGEARKLAQLVHGKAGGNPFFTVQFLTTLADEGALTFDPGTLSWTWNLSRVRTKGATNNVADLVVEKLNRLPPVTLDATRQLACLGSRASSSVLSSVLGLSEDETRATMRRILRVGLVLRTDDGYAFLHDRVQEAAYASIPEDERPAAHLRIGRLLASTLPATEVDEKIFEIVDHFIRGSALIHAPMEKAHVAGLFLKAGHRAKASTAIASALKYVSVSNDLLDGHGWSQAPALTFSAALLRAECEYLSGHLALAGARLAELAPRAATQPDRAAVTCLRVDLFTTMDHAERAVEAGLEYLQAVGIRWGPHPSDEEVDREFEAIRMRLGSDSIASIVDRPVMTDTDALATIDVLTAVHAPANFLDGNLLALIIGRIANLSLEHGSSDGASFAFVYLGGLLESRFGDFRAGFEFGRAGVDLMEQRGLDRYRTRVLCNFGNAINSWTQPVRSSVELLRQGFAAARDEGDPTFMAYNLTNIVTALLVAGGPLSELQREAEAGLELVQQARFGLGGDLTLAQLGLVRALRGMTPSLSSFQFEGFDEEQFEEQLEKDSAEAMAACWYWIRKLQAHFLAGNFCEAASGAGRAKELAWTSPAFLILAEYHFYAALAAAALHEESSANERSALLETLDAHREQLEKWSETCPANFGNRALLVTAERARIDGRSDDAMRGYEQAIQSARAQGFVQNEALAHELAARFYAARGLETLAIACLREARTCYLRWGADGKVRQLDNLHPRLREDRGPFEMMGMSASSEQDLDLLALARSTEAIAEEIVLGKLIGMLMTISVECAGAERGLLVLTNGDAPAIAAEAIVSNGRVEVAQRDTAATSADLSMTVLQFTMRTRESVILDDATAGQFCAEDDYVRRKRPKSILCLPIVKQAKLMGALYLENNLASGVFTAGRVSVLSLLASRAAISLENAKLYADLERENAERKRVEEELRRSESLMAEGQRVGHTGSWAWNVRTGNLTWSAEHKRMFGFPPEQEVLTFDDFAATIHPDDRTKALRELDEAIESAAPFDQEFRIVLPDGAIRVVHGTGRPMLDAAGQPTEYYGAVADITVRKNAEADLEAALARVTESQDQLRTIIDTIPSLSWTSAPDGNCEFFSRRSLEYVGCSLEEAQGGGWETAIHSDDLENVRSVWRRMLTSCAPDEVEARLRRSDGVYRWFLLRAAPLFDAGGRVVKWYGTNTDIEELKRAETFLAGEKKVFELIANGKPQRAILDVLCQIVEELAEGTLASILLVDDDGKRLRHGASPNLPAAWTDAIDGALIGPRAGSCGTAACLGRKIYVSDIAHDPLWVDYRDQALRYDLKACWSSPIFSSDRSVLGTFAIYSRTARDITPDEERIVEQFTHLASMVVERKRAQDAIRKNEAFLAEAQRIAHVGYWERDLETGAITWSDETYRIFGISRDEDDLDFSKLSAAIHPDDRPLVVRAIERALLDDSRYDVEYRVVRPGGEVRVVQSIGDVVQEEAGRGRRMFGIVQDITERRQAEDELRRSEAHLRKTQAELAHVARTTTMGELAASIAHEVSQPLTGVMANASASLRWLEADTPNLEEARGSMQRVVRDGRRAGEVIARIRKLFRKEELTKEPLNINEVIEEVVVLVRSELHKNGVDLQMRLAADLQPVLGDRVQLQQVLMNLILNGVDAMRLVTDRARELTIVSRAGTESSVCVDVVDTGCGIARDDVEKIFEPFLTSKPSGMGMGLAICRTIIENHGGNLRVVSDHAPGACFRFTLGTFGELPG